MLYDMRSRLAVGCLALPHAASPATGATSPAPPVQPHPRVGRKAPKMSPKSAPAVSTTEQSTGITIRLSPLKGKSKKKKRKQAAAAGSLKPKKVKKRAASDASSSTEVECSQVVFKTEAPLDTESGPSKQSKKAAPKEAPPMESSDSQAEGPFTKRSDTDGTESAPESKGVSSSHR